jgi:copper transport protein
MAAAAIVAAVVALTATPAFGHASLERTEPAAGSHLAVAPDAIVLTFTEGVRVAGNGVRVLDTDCRAIDTGLARHGASDRTVSVALPPLAAGSHVVSWRVVSADGHPIQGAFTFTVGDANDDRGGDCNTPQGASRALGIAYLLVRVAQFAGVLVFAGGLGFVALFGALHLGGRGARTVLASAWVVTFTSTLVGLGVQGAYTNGDGLGSILGADAFRAVLDERAGTAALLRLALLVVAAPIAERLLRVEPPPPSGVLAAAGVAAVGLAATPAGTGHAGTGYAPAVGVPLDVVHVLAAALWLGGLVLLAAAVLVPLGSDHARQLVPRFSRLAFVAVVALVATGVGQSIRQLGSVRALWDSTFGRLLVAKVVAVVCMVAIGARSRDTTRHRLDHDGHDTEAARRRLRRSVVAEIVVAAVVVAITAGLVNAPPGRAHAGSDAQPYTATLAGGDADFDVSIAPGGTGHNEVRVTVLGNDGRPREVLDLAATVALAELDIAPIDIAFHAEGTGAYVGHVDLALPGAWTLEIRALLTEIDEAVATATVDI